MSRLPHALRWSALLALVAACGSDVQSTGPHTNPPTPEPPVPQIDLPGGRVAFVSDRDGADAIYVTNTDRTGITRLTAGNSPAWSRDGRIAFVSGTSGSDGFGIYVINANGSSRRFLAAGLNPAWSPDGARIAFNGPDVSGLEGIFVINADGSGLHKLIDATFPDGDGAGGSSVERPAWSPDGHSIAFLRTTADIPWSIYLMNADGSAPHLLNLPYMVGETRFAWSPDGTRFLLQALALESDGWAITSTDANGLARHTYVSARYVGGPDWSPSASDILYERFAGPPDGKGPLGTRLRLFVLRIKDGVEHQLIPEAVSPVRADYQDRQAAWSRLADFDY